MQDFTAALSTTPDLAHGMRKLGRFRAAFEDDARRLGARHGWRYDIDEQALARMFFDWIDAIGAQADGARANRADFTLFCGGLALAGLVRSAPARAHATGRPASRGDQELAADRIARFWPEGLLYVDFCISVVSAVFEQEFGAPPPLDPCLDDLRTWWSFRENVAEDPALAAAFFDRFLGRQTDWTFPGQLGMRPDAAIEDGRDAPAKAIARN